MLKVSERFAFLPREAVTRFLLGCADCRRRVDSECSSSTPKRLRAEEYVPINLTTRSCVIRLSVPACTPPTVDSPEDNHYRAGSTTEEENGESPTSTDEDVIIRIPDPRVSYLKISPIIINCFYSMVKLAMMSYISVS